MITMRKGKLIKKKNMILMDVGPNPIEAASLVYHFIGLHHYNIINVYSGNNCWFTTSFIKIISLCEIQNGIKIKEIQIQYPNLLERFLDFCKFVGLDVEEKAIKFWSFGKFKS